MTAPFVAVGVSTGASGAAATQTATSVVFTTGAMVEDGSIVVLPVDQPSNT